MNNLQLDKYPQDKPQIGHLKKVINGYKKLVACNCHQCGQNCGLFISPEDKKEDDKDI